MANMIFERDVEYANSGEEVMTLNGAIQKSVLLFGIAGIFAVLGFLYTGEILSFLNLPSFGKVSSVGMFSIVVMVICMILGFIMYLKPKLSPILAPIYAVIEGIFLGVISLLFESFFQGIILQAATVTFVIFLTMLGLYYARIIKVTEKLKSGIIGATLGVFILYVVSIGGRFAGFEMDFMFGNGPLSIGISVFIIAIASFNLLLDFDAIETLSDSEAPKYYEWYTGYGLLATVVWIYIEVLRILAKIYSED